MLSGGGSSALLKSVKRRRAWLATGTAALEAAAAVTWPGSAAAALTLPGVGRTGSGVAGGSVPFTAAGTRGTAAVFAETAATGPGDSAAADDPGGCISPSSVTVSSINTCSVLRGAMCRVNALLSKNNGTALEAHLYPGGTTKLRLCHSSAATWRR